MKTEVDFVVKGLKSLIYSIQPYKVYGHNPVLALVNSKSGDNQGVKFLRRLKFWLNPAQVFDLAISGPDLG